MGKYDGWEPLRDEGARDDEATELATNLLELDRNPSPGQPGQAQGRVALKGVIRQMRRALPDIHWTEDEMVAEGDIVFSRFTCSGTHEGAFPVVM